MSNLQQIESASNSVVLRTFTRGSLLNRCANGFQSGDIVRNNNIRLFLENGIPALKLLNEVHNRICGLGGINNDSDQSAVDSAVESVWTQTFDLTLPS